MGAAQAKVARRVEQNDPSLTILSLSNSIGFVPADVEEELGTYWPSDSFDLLRLGNAIGSNTNLKILNIRNTDGECLDSMAANGAFMDRLEYNSSINGLWLVNFQLFQGMGHDILKYFVAGNRNVTGIRFTECTLMNGGTSAVTSAAAGCPNLTDIKLVRCDVDNEILEEFVSGITGLDRLCTLGLPMNAIGRAGCEVLSTLLRDPKCNLEYLDLCFNFMIDDSCAAILANSMKVNRKLKSIILVGSEITERGWHGFARVLCDASSLNKTHLSNHVLQDFGNVPLPANLSILLRLNSNNDKKQVAIQKILLRNAYFNMEPFHREWGMKMLPVAVSWFDRARCSARRIKQNFDAKKLSAIYQFAKTLPMMLVLSPKKVELEKDHEGETCRKGLRIKNRS
mmetsp:Transcript_38504/g.80681  ORF Transcript_38504/g.80681 Transcript_38504/m.80681 type:complete len:398 (-) Transcript_38504:474-1667(-)